MRVLYFGAYNPNYARNSVLINGLKQNGVEIIECRDDSPGLKKFIKLFFKHWGLRNQYDAIIVGFLGQVIAPFARIINSPLVSFRKRKPFVFDMFMSLYDSNVFGREKIKPGSRRAGYYWFLDWLSIHSADKVLLDTQQHINYVSQEFGINKNKLAKIFVGTQEDIFYPRPQGKNDNTFKVLFHGTFIKSHGIEFVLRAAKILEQYQDIRFIFVGDGQVKGEMVDLAENLKLKNVEFLGRMPLVDVTKHIAEADVCLGLFGKAPKIQRVIPNKAFECVAMGKTVITADTPAIRELFSDKEMMLVQVADPEGIADAILKLKNDPVLNKQLSTRGHEIFKKRATINILGGELKEIILDLQKSV